MANFNRSEEDGKYRSDLQGKENETRRVNFLENTSHYIEHYLNPNRKWSRETSAKQRIDLIRYADVNWMAISDHIKGMDYRNFLATPYWKAITAYTRYKAGYRCQLCNNGANLVTHHRNYGIHGREHAHMNELIVLCNHCHQKFHRKEKITPPRSDHVAIKARITIPRLIILCLFILVMGSVMAIFSPHTTKNDLETETRRENAKSRW